LFKNHFTILLSNLADYFILSVIVRFYDSAVNKKPSCRGGSFVHIKHRIADCLANNTILNAAAAHHVFD